MESTESKIQSYPDSGTFVDFDGAPDPEVEAWVGSSFESWRPDAGELVIRFDNGLDAVVRAGDRLARRADGILRLYFGGVEA